MEIICDSTDVVFDNKSRIVLDLSSPARAREASDESLRSETNVGNKTPYLVLCTIQNK